MAGLLSAGEQTLTLWVETSRQTGSDSITHVPGDATEPSEITTPEDESASYPEALTLRERSDMPTSHEDLTVDFVSDLNGDLAPSPSTTPVM